MAITADKSYSLSWGDYISMDRDTYALKKEIIDFRDHAFDIKTTRLCHSLESLVNRVTLIIYKLRANSFLSKDEPSILLVNYMNHRIETIRNEAYSWDGGGRPKAYTSTALYMRNGCIHDCSDLALKGILLSSHIKDKKTEKFLFVDPEKEYNAKHYKTKSFTADKTNSSSSDSSSDCSQTDGFISAFSSSFSEPSNNSSFHACSDTDHDSYVFDMHVHLPDISDCGPGGDLTPNPYDPCPDISHH
jgi:hypothetical protein